MSKWTWASALAFAAILGGGYLLLSRPASKGGESAPKADSGEVDVDNYDGAGEQAEGDGDKSDNTYDMLEDPDAAAGGPSGSAEIETLEDDDGAGAVDAGRGREVGMPGDAGTAPPGEATEVPAPAAKGAAGAAGAAGHPASK